MPNLYDRQITDNEFKQRVRRHAPSSLLPLVAAVSAAHSRRDQWIASPYRKYTPWALAEVARTSLSYGMESRGVASQQDLLACCAAYVAMRDPALSAPMNPTNFWNFARRMAYEQLLFQLPLFNELARSISLFTKCTPRTPLSTLNGNWAESLFGCTVNNYVATGLLMHIGAIENSGRFALDWLEQPNFSAVLSDLLPPGTVRQIIENEFVTTVDLIRSMDPGSPQRQHPDLRRFNFNPLQSKPAITGLAAELLVPSPGLLARKVSTLGIFYSGVEKWGVGFSNDLGHLFEAYVGLQLELLKDATILPCVTYGRSKNESVDWFAIFDDVVWLVEVKATRSTEAIRTASDTAGSDLARTLGKAVRQIDRTAELVKSRNTEFQTIPADRPILGVVVTMEPFYNANSTDTKAHLPAIDVPYVICSARELEDIVTCTSAPIGATLLSHILDPTKDGWSADSAFQGQQREHNQVLMTAWNELPWSDNSALDALADQQNGI